MVGVYPPQFVRRDRTQVGLSQSVLMVQSDLTGGSLHASRAAALGKLVALNTREDYPVFVEAFCKVDEPRSDRLL